MLAKITSCTPIGVSGLLVDVEVDVSMGLPVFSTVGLPDNAVKENKDRVKAAIRNCGYEFPSRRITVNLAPADVKKEGAGFDLPTAIGILCAIELVNQEKINNCCITGELSLDGGVRRVKGILPMLMAAREAGLKRCLIPEENRAEAAIVADQLDIFPVKSLPEAVEFFLGTNQLMPLEVSQTRHGASDVLYDVDFSEVLGQQHVKRALEIAASGGHNLLMQGPPGSGKTMLARRVPTILPEMNVSEIIETTKIYSVSNLRFNGTALQLTRPFRDPHHTISDAGLIGGGNHPRPGEVSLAHNGVLFLDELPEFKKHVLEVLRQPLEDGCVTISRATTSLNFPARFILIVSMNPCPCGYLGDRRNNCTCTSTQIQRYQTRISGPLLDRIDLHLTVSALEYDELQDNSAVAEGSAEIRKRVNNVRELQKKRFASSAGIHCNGQMRTREINKYCQLDSQSSSLLRKGVEKLGLSARGYHRILKISRTIADMAGARSIQPGHVAEAIQYRRSQF